MVDGCPSEERLQDLLDAADDADAAIESHVRTCMRCQQRLDVLTEYPLLAAAGRDTAWTESHSGAVISHVAAALVMDSKHGSLSGNSLTKSGDDTAESRKPAIPGYEIFNRIGTGGSSDVYRAFHTQLRRVVALKISRDRARPEQRDRFRREAEAIARLSHPGIIQIFETGQVNGSIFMSLEYEAHGSLSQFLKGDPQPAVDAARFVAAAALAVHAAHQQGLIHRDLKPGNLLLHAHSANADTRSLADFSPKVTDFGLVKQLAEESALTASRDVLGTPSYMAPEQVSTGDHPVGPATDVYALGTVLYEMLTGRPPFRAATAIDTVVQVRFDEPVPPSRLAPSIPTDLETVCLKCLEKEPGRRYRTAEDLANDLTRFVEGRPVKARPVRWPIRMWRWTRRNPRVAGLTAAVFTLLAALAVLGPVIALRQTALRQNAQDSEAKAILQWDRADRNLLAANDAVWGAMMLKVTELDAVTSPGASDEQLKVIEGAMTVLEKARVKDPDLPNLRQRWAMALYLHGRAARRGGDSARAEADLMEASAFADRLAEDRPDIPENRVLVALIRLEMAHVATLRSQADAESRTRDAIARFEQLTRQHPQVVDGWYGLADACHLLVDRLDAQPGRETEVTHMLRRQIDTLSRIGTFPTDRISQEPEVGARLRLAKHHLKQQNPNDAVAEYRAALAAAMRTPRGGLSPSLILRRSATMQLLADQLAAPDTLNEAHRHAAASARIAASLLDLFPDAANYKTQLVKSKLAQVKILKMQNDTAAAEKILNEATALAATLPASSETTAQIGKLRQMLEGMK